MQPGYMQRALDDFAAQAAARRHREVALLLVQSSDEAQVVDSDHEGPKHPRLGLLLWLSDRAFKVSSGSV